MSDVLLHQPIMVKEICQGLAIKKDGIYIDATFGRGGHSLAILNNLGPLGKLFAYDKDPEAVAFANNLSDKRLEVSHMSYVDLAKDIKSRGYFGKIDGILMDVGVSSPQLDDAARGFSFMRNGPLDMRMDNSQGITAADWINSADEDEIVRVLKLYGEERFAKFIAKEIVAYRINENEINTTETLVAIIKKAVGTRYQKEKHPATRTFQALRVVVNSELDELEECLGSLVDLLAPNGRLAVMTFHSLEHRLVRKFMQNYLPGNEDMVSALFSNKEIKFKKTSGVITASEQEQRANPRSRSAQCRIVERLAC